MDTQKVVVVKRWPKTTTPSNIQSFMGLASYFRPFVELISLIAAPLTKLTKKKVKFSWSDACEGIFKKLKDKLTLSTNSNIVKRQ